MSQALTQLYRIKKIASTASPVEWKGIEELTSHICNGYVVLWQHHAIFIGIIEVGKVHWLNDAQPVDGHNRFLRLRAFNASTEYHFWRSGADFRGRLRIDAEGDSSEIVDTKMKLRSVIGKPLRKAHPDLATEDLAVVTRNYISYDKATQQAGYVDSRFLDFKPF